MPDSQPMYFYSIRPYVYTNLNIVSNIVLTPPRYVTCNAEVLGMKCYKSESHRLYIQNKNRKRRLRGKKCQTITKK